MLTLCLAKKKKHWKYLHSLLIWTHTCDIFYWNKLGIHIYIFFTAHTHFTYFDTYFHYILVVKIILEVYINISLNRKSWIILTHTCIIYLWVVKITFERKIQHYFKQQIHINLFWHILVLNIHRQNKFWKYTWTFL